MKRLLAAFVAVAALAAPLAAQDFRLLAGFGFTPTFTYQYFVTPILDWENTVTSTEPSVQAFLGVEFLYFRAQVGLMWSFDTSIQTTVDSGGSTSTSKSTDTDTGTWLTLAGYGFIPFKAFGMSLYAIGGLKADLNLAYVDETGADLREGLSDNDLAHLDRVFLQLGVGTSFKLSGDLGMRFELLGGWKIPSRNDAAWTDGTDTNVLRDLSLDIFLVFSYSM